MKRNGIIFVVFIAAAATAACLSGGNSPEIVNNNSVIGGQTGESNRGELNDAGKSKEEPIEMKEIYPTEKYSQDTPTDAMRTWVMATVNKDIPALKQVMSASSIAVFEKSASEQGKSVGEILTAGAVEDISKKIPEFRNQKITGDIASVEYKDETMKEFLAMPLVRENGKWKIAYDVFTQELIMKLTQDMNNPAPKKRK